MSPQLEAVSLLRCLGVLDGSGLPGNIRQHETGHDVNDVADKIALQIQ
jgi:hypothetical protein